MMLKLFLALTVLAGSIGVPIFMGTPILSQAAHAQKSASTQHVIEIHKMKFQTKSLDVKIGDTVTWINKDIVAHTATALDKSWDSGRLKKGESFTLTITDQTSLDYFCLYHRQMKAELIRA